MRGFVTTKHIFPAFVVITQAGLFSSDFYNLEITVMPFEASGKSV
jgi:hypothetical protein